MSSGPLREAIAVLQARVEALEMEVGDLRADLALLKKKAAPTGSGWAGRWSRWRKCGRGN